MTAAGPFTVLGIEPTLERAAIKRAYFGALQRHPPHVDPQGFRKIRDAYETLTGEGLMTAWATAEIDITRELRALEEELQPKIELAQRELEALEAPRIAIAGFEALLTLDLTTARDRCR